MFCYIETGLAAVAPQSFSSVLPRQIVHCCLSSRESIATRPAAFVRLLRAAVGEDAGQTSCRPVSCTFKANRSESWRARRLPASKCQSKWFHFHSDCHSFSSLADFSILLILLPYAKVRCIFSLLFAAALCMFVFFAHCLLTSCLSPLYSTDK